MNFTSLSAVSSGISDIRKVSDEILSNPNLSKTILFLDEIHRFSKSQQDSLLPLIENGIIILIGATTEHPGFSIINPLISRVKIFKFEPHDALTLNKILKKVLDNTEEYLKTDENIIIANNVLDTLITGSSGDARKALDTFELAVNSTIKKMGRKR